jgi:transposase
MKAQDTSITEVHTERVDDIPLLGGLLDKMNLQPIIDSIIHPHANHRGLSVGWLIKLWLIHILSAQSHCLNLVRDWVKSVPETLARLTGQPLSELDCTDDRLADGLRYLSVDADWHRIEQQVGQHLIRVYDLPTARVRLDSTTATVGHDPEQHTLFQVGKTKAGTYDTQFKLMLASLDPLGLPLAADVVAGNCADDPLYVPCYRRIKATLARDGLLLVGDSKISALETRAAIVAGRDYYLLPYPYAKDAPDWLPELLQPVWEKRQALHPVFLPEDRPTDASALDPKLALAEGFEVTRVQTAKLAGRPHTWEERCLVVRSCAYAETEGAALHQRLTRAEADLRQLTPPRGRGQHPIREEAALQAQVTALLGHYRVAGLLDVTWGREVTVHPKRAYRGQPAHTEEDVRYVITAVQRNPAAIEQAERLLGWRIYLTQAPVAELTLAEAVLAYRAEYIIENLFRRLKGHRLSLIPLYLHRDDHALGLVRLLTLAARLLAVAEYRVHCQLAAAGEELCGLYAGQPQRTTQRPTTERLLQAFQQLTLTVFTATRPQIRHLPALTPLQARILALLDLSPMLYTDLVAA